MNTHARLQGTLGPAFDHLSFQANAFGLNSKEKWIRGRIFKSERDMMPF